MEVSATLRYARMSAQKARLVANLVRGQYVDKAVEQMRFCPKKAAGLIRGVILSAMANAENNLGADIDELYIAKIYVDEGPKFKRFRARAKGRGTRILKRTCHITVTVSDSGE